MAFREAKEAFRGVVTLSLYPYVLSPGRSRKLVRPEPVLNAQSCMYLFLKCILPARPLPKCVPSSLSHVGDADMEGKVALTVLC